MQMRSLTCWWTVLVSFDARRAVGAFTAALSVLSAGPALSDTNFQIWIDRQEIALPDAPARINFSDRPAVDTLELIVESPAQAWGARLVLVRSGHGNWRVVSTNVIENDSDIVLAAGETVDAGEVRLETFSGSEEHAAINVSGEFASFTVGADPFSLIPITPPPPARPFRISVVFDWPE